MCCEILSATAAASSRSSVASRQTNITGFSPYLNYDPRILQQAQPEFIFPEGASKQRGRFELAFSQIGSAVIVSRIEYRRVVMSFIINVNCLLIYRLVLDSGAQLVYIMESEQQHWQIKQENFDEHSESIGEQQLKLSIKIY